jgi:hypothetical protein
MLDKIFERGIKWPIRHPQARGACGWVMGIKPTELSAHGFSHFNLGGNVVGKDLRKSGIRDGYAVFFELRENF